MFRIGTPVLTIIIFLITVGVFIFQIFLEEKELNELWFKPSQAFSKPWTFVTSIFLHAGPSHLFLNMFALLMFGSFLEPRIGQRRFLTIYFLSGIFGNLAYWLTSPLGEIPAVGASGAIYGILGATAILYPTLIVWFFPGIPVPIIIAAFFWVLISFFGMFIPSSIAYQAHLAGLIVGFYFGFRIRRLRKKYWYELI